ncbi:MAG TPA: NAD-dependent epimerase/dehydratase family protein [Rubrivivax sp.]|nr:NAD-dependent epimerase/dehydratase family protein [Burkholderiales bacterium]HNT38959.1 NAD-dependent epimerase/dehydratase family protein [Rubrivivax sp.]
MNPPLHLILGDGVVGCAAAQELARRGIPHALASRTPPANTAPGGTGAHRRVEALDAESLLAASADASHLHLTLGLPYDARVWERDWPRVIENAIAAARAHRLRLVMFDNLYGYGPVPLRQPIREDHPQQPTSRKGRVRKAIGERLLRAAREDGVPVLIARASDFYGPGVRNTVLFAAAIERQLRGKAAQWLGDPDRLHSYTYVPDAARGLVELALDEGAYGQVWHLPTMSPAPTSRALLQMSARLLGAPQRVQVLPAAMQSALGLFVPILRELREIRYQHAQDFVLSSERFMQRYPAFRITPYEEGIEATVRSFRPG